MKASPMNNPTGTDIAPTPAVTDVEPDIVAIKKAFLFDYLAALDVAVVEIYYNGSGDDGQIDTITARRSDNSTIPLQSGPSISHVVAGETETYQSIRDYLDSFAWDVIETEHEGFEIDDGGCGTLTVDVVARTLRLEKTNYVLSSDTETVEV